MFCTGINLQIFEQSGAQSRAGQHALHGFLDQERRFFSEILHGGSETLAAGVTRVTRIDLVGHLFARELHLFGIDYDHVVAAISMWGVAGLVLTSENLRDLRGKPSQDLAIGIDHHPFFGDGSGIGRDRLVA